MLFYLSFHIVHSFWLCFPVRKLYSYETDGAHEGVDELEPGIAPPGSSSECAATNTCPAPMYMINGTYQGEFSNIESIAPLQGSEDFGLDAVEPFFFYPLGDWEGFGAFETVLNFDVTDFAQDIFYFCHVHSGMSARIKFLDASGNKVQPDADTPPLGYEYDVINSYDDGCGSFGISDFQLPNGQCPEQFVVSLHLRSEQGLTLVDFIGSVALILSAF